MRIIGVDPGLRTLGWGVIEVSGNRMTHVANGLCKSDSATPLALRLQQIFRALGEVIALHGPDAAAIEETFVNRDGQGTLKLGQARGVAMLALAEAGLVPGEYAPNKVKKSVAGTGHAAKGQIAHMVAHHFPGVKLAGADAADALAIAICHAHHSGPGAARVAAALRAAG